jgi:hypothetical protein
MKYSFDFAVLFSNSLVDVNFFTAMWAYCVISVSLGDNWIVSWQLYVLQRKLQQKEEHKVLELSFRQRRTKENSNVFVYEGKVAT